MGDTNSRTTKFIIKDIHKLKKALNPLEKKFNISRATESAVLNMVNRIAKSKNVNPDTIQINAAYSHTTIRKNLKKGVVTQRMFHSILCLLLNEFEVVDKYSQTYTSTSIKKFLEQLELEYNEPGSIRDFRDFFASLIIPEKFDDFEIRVDENWNFDLTDGVEEESKEILSDIETPNDNILNSKETESFEEKLRKAAKENQDLFEKKTGKEIHTYVSLTIGEEKAPKELTEFEKKLKQAAKENQDMFEDKSMPTKNKTSKD